MLRDLPAKLSVDDFYVSNPGWQGSNTFMHFPLLWAAGGFREGLVSCNDRDLAIRVLKRSDVQVGYTGAWTATWHLESNRDALSHGRSAAKRAGLQGFWHLHGEEMGPDQRKRFFAQAESRFGITPAEILPPPTQRFRLLVADAAA